MLRYLILSDIHGNREALDAVLVAAQGQYDQVACLGDLVGYGADPNYVVEWARASVSAIIRGNHDRVMFENDSDAAYRGEAQDSTRWTRRALTPENLDYLRRLPKGPLPWGGFDLVHGSPLDEDQYLVKASDVAPLGPSLRSPLTFFGHTHVQGGFLLTASGVVPVDPSGPVEIDPRDRHYLLNPGSVGQPRDGNWRAACALYSADERRVEFVRVPYNAGPTAEKIVLAGMPAMLAARLLMGK